MNKKELLAALIERITDLKPLIPGRSKVSGYMAASGAYEVTLNGFFFTLDDYGHYHHMNEKKETRGLPKEERLWNIQFINHTDFYWHTRENDGVMQFSTIGTFNEQVIPDDWVNI